MSRLPSALQPAWPLLKRLHRATSFCFGMVFRRASFLWDERALPGRATMRSIDTAAREPGTVSVHVAGEAELISRTMPEGDPPGHFTFAEGMTYEVPPPQCTEVIGGTVVGAQGANVTPAGTLDYETSGYFGIASWREHPMFLRPRLPPVEQVDGTVVSLAARGGRVNYYHFLMEVLPRMGVLREVMPDLQIDALYVPHVTRYHRELIQTLGLDAHRIIDASDDRAVRADRLIIPSMPNPDEIAPSWVVNWIRDALPPQPVADGPRRIYVTRGGARNTRRLIQEPALWPELERRGFVRIDPGSMSVREQIDTFAGAETIVALHGAALTNLVFASPGARVLELFPPGYVKMCFWAITTNISDVRYRYLVAGGEDAYRPSRAMNAIQADIDLEPQLVLDALDALLKQ